MKTYRSKVEGKKKQGGLVVVLFTLCLLILLGFAALAIDINHMILNKSRLQNSVDSAALASSVAIENGSTSRLSIDQSLATLGETASASGNSELLFGGNYNQLTQVSNTKYVAEYDDYEVYYYFSNNPTEFGETLDNFQEDRDIYTRVVVSDHSLESYLIHIFGLAKSVSASAVSGRSSGFIGTGNIAPIGVCETNEDGSVKTFDDAKEYALAGECSSENDNKCPDTPTGEDIGNGNYNFLDLDGYKNGAVGLEDALAGSAPDGLTGQDGIYVIDVDTIETQPGKNNSIEEGFNSRFEPTDSYPAPDAVEAQRQENISFAEYQAAGGSKNGRRVITVPVVTCGVGGKSEPVTVKGFECFFLTQKYDKQEKIVWGEYIAEGCAVANGVGGNDPIDSGPYRIQLYKDPYSGES
ncbi:Tad domain-containing protein [Vibrio breoganii]|uniref:Tad domain-containing protein n=1 Tax=Vibrio breoganii TaxID=553239 RepID=UPI000C82E1F0|nr:Tad domain-containing protein [Vibrio breoganii]PMK46249.1 hypothetical protein BCU00_07710 [Vibrio breoganii]